MENVFFSISFRKQSGEERKNDLLTSIIKKSILFAGAIIKSPARASYVFLSSYRDKIINESALIFLRLFFNSFYCGKKTNRM